MQQFLMSGVAMDGMIVILVKWVISPLLLFVIGLVTYLAKKYSDRLDNTMSKDQALKLEEDLKEFVKMKIEPITTKIDGLNEKIEKVDKRFDGVYDRLNTLIDMQIKGKS